MSLGYIFLAIALMGGTAKAYCGKMTSEYVEKTQDALLFNLTRMLLCVIIGICMILPEVRTLSFDRTTILISLMAGIASSTYVVSWIISVKTGAFVMIDVFVMLGTIIPITFSGIMFNEATKVTQWIGYALLICSVCILCSYNNSVKKKMDLKSFGILIIGGISNGFADLSQKMFVRMRPEGSIAVFNLYTYIFSAVILFAMLCIMHGNALPVKRPKKIGVYLFIMAIGLFINSYFKSYAAVYISASQLYPLNQGAALIISIIMATTAFKEKITLRSITGLCLAFASLCIINLS